MCLPFTISLHFNYYCRFYEEDGEEGVGVTVQKELSVLLGVMEHILPHVGSHVLTLDLSHSKALTNEVVSPPLPYPFQTKFWISAQVFRMLRQCPQLRFLDLSHTNISDFAFRG